jgi:DNA mismatch repair protein MSH6
MGNSFVPNDTLMNTQGVANVLVVTGPNMGGKSTVLRQTCLAVIMAQLGCRVNAAVCRLTPVDRIFTRIGSYDTILEGKSTLLLELEETAAVIRHGTRRSLAVLDELGRGTSTFDGAAIASAVLDDLAHRLGCMVLFATHYHPVSREAVRSPQVAPFHMAAEVDERTNQMTFLYRFLPGLCPASHGHHVARLAGLPEAVVEEALARSAEFERSGRSLAAASGEGAGSAANSEGGAAALGISLTQLAGAKDAEGLRSLFRSLPRGE